MIFIQDIILTILLFYLGTLIYNDFKDMNL